jgi:hypothetical protein
MGVTDLTATIGIGLGTLGVIASLLNKYISAKRKTTITITSGSGEKIVISADHITSANVADIVAVLGGEKRDTKIPSD